MPLCLTDVSLTHCREVVLPTPALTVCRRTQVLVRSIVRTIVLLFYCSIVLCDTARTLHHTMEKHIFHMNGASSEEND